MKLDMFRFENNRFSVYASFFFLIIFDRSSRGSLIRLYYTIISCDTAQRNILNLLGVFLAALKSLHTITVYLKMKVNISGIRFMKKEYFSQLTCYRC